MKCQSDCRTTLFQPLEISLGRLSTTLSVRLLSRSVLMRRFVRTSSTIKIVTYLSNSYCQISIHKKMCENGCQNLTFFLLEHYDNDYDDFLSHIVSGDGLNDHILSNNNNHQHEKFWDRNGILLIDFLSRRVTVNAEKYYHSKLNWYKRYHSA